MTLNVQSVKGKINLVEELIVTNDADVICITETWLKKNDEDAVWLKLTFLDNKSYRVQPISRQRGSGLLLIYKCCYKQELFKEANYPMFESATWKLKIGNVSVIVTGTYHPPQVVGLLHLMFIDQLSEYLMDVLSQYSNNIVVGDFNMHVNDHNNVDVCLLFDTLSALGLSQKVSVATHSKGHMLDLIFVEDTISFDVLKVETLEFISDHRPVACILSIQKLSLLRCKSNK